MNIFYSIILEDEIFYCSNKAYYNLFEVVVFIEKLLRRINPSHVWRLSDIYLKAQDPNIECILIKHIVSEGGKDLFYCITGDFSKKSQQAPKILEDFYEKVQNSYSNIEKLKQASNQPFFKDIIELTAPYVKFKHETLSIKGPNFQMAPLTENKIIYCGISSQGLPIISKLYDVNRLLDLNKEITGENIELFTSGLSANLATIAMNAMIRAQTKINEIHVIHINEVNLRQVILYGNINGYSLDFIASGDVRCLKGYFKILLNKFSREKILQTEFSGDLKPFKYLQNMIDKEINNLNNLNYSHPDGK